MNAIEKMRAELIRSFPGASIELDAPGDQAGPWFLDVERPGLSPVVVEWRPGRGFGISTPTGDEYGPGADEIYSDSAEALARAVHLIASGESSRPPGPLPLGELRKARNLSQAEVAERMGISQPSVAGIEARGELMVPTLARFLAAMGATMKIVARFPDGSERELRI
jgi:hypothetical protein